MKAKILNLTYDAARGGFDDEALQGELAGKRGLSFQARFVDVASIPRLCCVLTWRDDDEARDEPTPSRNGSSRPARARMQAPPELDDADTRVFEALRSWRRARANELGVPAFRVLTDRQLAAVARARPLVSADLARLVDIGEARARRCGDELFAAVRASSP
jgi:superfamily II DNA helicase RecQ